MDTIFYLIVIVIFIFVFYLYLTKEIEKLNADKKVQGSYTYTFKYLLNNNDFWYGDIDIQEYQIVNINKKVIDELKEKIQINFSFDGKVELKELKNFKLFTQELEEYKKNNLFKSILQQFDFKEIVADFIKPGSLGLIIILLIKKMIESTMQQGTIFLTLKIIMYAFFFIGIFMFLVIEYEKIKRPIISNKLKSKAILIALDELIADGKVQ